MEVSTAVVPTSAKPLKHLNKIAQRPTLDIEFQDLKYSVKNISDGEWRCILNSVTGKFCYGELTAILGPSGSGKTTLLNILSGYIKNGVQGSIKINNNTRDMAVFRKLSSYIMQDNIIQPYLTVKEAMTYAANLKLGGSTKDEELTAVIEEVMDYLGLQTCENTQSEYLSGGQRKRLTIALELVNNPPVLFLDEPTTGLDDYAVKQCIYLLKKVSKLDRTVICTIHQPSSFLFQYFDQVYIIANGVCTYNGSPDKLVPFLSKTGYPCPSNYTPTDYIIELVYLCPSVVEELKTHSRNGKINMRENTTTVTKQFTAKIDVNSSSSFLDQFSLLLSRMILQIRRNRVALTIQFIHHVFSAMIIGLIFQGIGNNASRIFEIFKFCLCCNVFFSYTYVMGPVIAFPTEVKLMRREHFNGWYRLRAYYCALTVATLPLLIFLSTLFIVIIYFMTDQPKETHRFIGFYLINIVLGLTSQGLGYLIGSLFDMTKGAIIGPTVIASMLILGVYGIGYSYNNNTALFFNILRSLDFLRNGIIGLCSTLFYERKPLLCKEIYCHYAQPELLAKENSIPLFHYNYDLGHIIIFMVLFRVFVFIALKCTLNYEFTSRIIYYAKRIMKIFRII